MNIRQALAKSPVKQAIRDEGNGLLITVTRQASEYYEVVVTMGEMIYLTEAVVDEQAIELLLWERLRMQSILFEPGQAQPSLVPVQASPSPSTIEQLAAEHQLGTLIKSYKQRRAGMIGSWLMLGFGILSFVVTFRLLIDEAVEIWSKIIALLLVLPFSLFLLYMGYICILSSIKINDLLREIKDEIRGSYHTILLYERGLICSEWIERKGTWENDVTILPWNAVGYLQSSASMLSQGTVDTFTIKTKNGNTVDVSLGGQELVTAIEQRTNASLASAT